MHMKLVSVPFGARVDRVIVPVATTVILLGILRGLSVNVLSRFNVAYGWTWLASLLVGMGLLSVFFVTSRLARKLQTTDPGPQFASFLNRIKILSLVELLGFLVILRLMIAMRFGY
jgi:hypothetical protein